jgi:hypothetical protein
MVMRVVKRTQPAPYAGEPMRELFSALAGPDADALAGRVVTVAAAIASAEYAGLVEIDPSGQEAWPREQCAPPGDPLEVERWLRDSEVLKTLAATCGPVILPRDPYLGHPGFLAVPVPLGTLRQCRLWVAGHDFAEREQELLSRFATVAGRLLEAATGMEAALRMLRAVHAFAGDQPAVTPALRLCAGGAF